MKLFLKTAFRQKEETIKNLISMKTSKEGLQYEITITKKCITFLFSDDTSVVVEHDNLSVCDMDGMMTIPKDKQRVIDREISDLKKLIR